MKTSIRRKIGLLLGLCLIMLCSCGKSETNENAQYEETISSLTENQKYALIEIEDYAQPVLLVADTIYEYEAGINAAIDCNVYYTQEGTVKNLGHIEGTGTAYPVSYDKQGIYVAGGHFVTRYGIDQQKNELIVEESARVEYDKDGNPTYYYLDKENGEQTVKDESKLNALTEQYSEATVVNFK